MLSLYSISYLMTIKAAKTRRKLVLRTLWIFLGTKIFPSSSQIACSIKTTQEKHLDSGHGYPDRTSFIRMILGLQAVKDQDQNLPHTSSVETSLWLYNHPCVRGNTRVYCLYCRKPITLVIYPQNILWPLSHWPRLLPVLAALPLPIL